jgi:hypothetical protein
MWSVVYYKYYNEDYLCLIIFACYSWEMELSVDFDISLDNA